MPSQVPVFSLTTPSQVPVIALVDGATGSTARLDSYVTPLAGSTAIIAPFDVRLLPMTPTAMAANRAYYYRIPTNWFGALTCTKIRLFIGTSSGNLDVGVYNDNGSGMPGVRVVSSGSTASPGTLNRDITIASTLISGGQWLAVAADNATITFSGNNGTGTQGIGWGAAFQDTAFPLPANAAATIMVGRTIYLEGRP